MSPAPASSSKGRRRRVWRRCRLAARLLAVALLLGAAACAGSSQGPVITARGRVLMPAPLADIEGPHRGLFGREQLGGGWRVEARAQIQERVTLSRLLTVAANAHPAMRRAKAELLAAEARRGQAGAAPNPWLELDAKQLPVTHGTSFADSRWELMLHQPLPLGGEIGDRVERARFAEREALYRALALGLELELEVRLAFVEYWAAFACERLQQEAVTLQAQLAEAVQAAFERGTQAELAAAQAQARLARAQAALAQAQGTLAAARERLRVAVGDATLSLGRPPADWTVPAMPEGLSDLGREWALDHPLVRARQARAEAAQRDGPDLGWDDRDLILGVGYEYEGGRGIHWLNVELAVPLPVFDRGSDGARAAAADAQAAYAESDLALMRLLARVAHMREAHEAAQRRVAAYEDVVLPAARREVAVRERLAETDAEAATAWTEARVQLIAAQIEAWQARADLGRLRHELALLTGRTGS